MKLLTVTLGLLCVTLTVKASNEENSILQRILDLLTEEKRASCSGGVSSAVSADMQQALVDKHNELRRDARPTLLVSSVANMNKLVWNQEIADIAQQLVDKSAEGEKSDKEMADDGLKKDCSGIDLGQNLYWAEERTTELTEVVEKEWFKEHSFGGGALLYGDHCSVERMSRGRITCAHYTQIVWAKTTEVGCGVAYSSKGITHFACNYKTQGNIEGEYIFEDGAACSKCADNTWASGYRCEDKLCVACEVGDPECTVA